MHASVCMCVAKGGELLLRQQRRAGQREGLTS